MKYCCSRNHITNLWGFIDLLGGTIAYQVFFNQLFNGCIAVLLILAVIQHVFHAVPVILGVPLQQLRRVKPHFDIFLDDVIEARRFVAAVHILPQHGKSLLASHILIVGVPHIGIGLNVDEINYGS